MRNTTSILLKHDITPHYNFVCLSSESRDFVLYSAYAQTDNSDQGGELMLDQNDSHREKVYEETPTTDNPSVIKELEIVTTSPPEVDESLNSVTETDAPTIPFDEIPLFIKDPDTNYPQVEKEVVSRLLNGYGPEKDKIIVNVAVTTGGFATQVRALMGSVMAALLSGRKLRIVWDDLFLITNSTFSKLAISQDDPLIKKAMRPPITSFKQVKKIKKNRGYSSIFPDDVTIMNTVEDGIEFYLPMTYTNNILKEIGLINYNKEFHPILARIILQPIDEIAYAIRSTKRQFSFDNCITIQARVGGPYSVSHERYQFISLSSLYHTVIQINGMYKNHEPVFLATDSVSLIPQIKEMLSEHPLIIAPFFDVAHTSVLSSKGELHVSALKRALLDIILASNCNPIYTTWGSAFGMLTMSLSNHFKNIPIFKDL